MPAAVVRRRYAATVALKKKEFVSLVVISVTSLFVQTAVI